MKIRTSTDISGKQDTMLRWLLLAVLSGTVLGSAMYSMQPLQAFWQEILFRQGIGTTQAALDFPKMMLSICGISLFWLCCVFVFGTSFLGAPFAIGLLVFRGMALGAVLSELYFQQELTGILTACLFVMPYALLSTFLFVLGIKESVRFSVSMLRMLLRSKEEELPVRLYAVRFLVLAAALLAAGVLQCLWLKYGYIAFLELMTGS